jgi:hypothetical protein
VITFRTLLVSLFCSRFLPDGVGPERNISQITEVCGNCCPAPHDAWFCRDVVEALGGSEAVLATELGPIPHPLESISDAGIREIVAQVGPTS